MSDAIGKALEIYASKTSEEGKELQNTAPNSLVFSNDKNTVYFNNNLYGSIVLGNDTRALTEHISSSAGDTRNAEIFGDISNYEFYRKCISKGIPFYGYVKRSDNVDESMFVSLQTQLNTNDITFYYYLLFRNRITLNKLIVKVKTDLWVCESNVKTLPDAISDDTTLGDYTKTNIALSIKDFNIHCQRIDLTNYTIENNIINLTASNLNSIFTNYASLWLLLLGKTYRSFYILIKDVNSQIVYIPCSIYNDTSNDRFNITGYFGDKKLIGYLNYSSGNFTDSTVTIEDNLQNGPNVINNLTSTSTTDALSAAQGKALNDKINALGNVYRVKGTKNNINEVLALTDAKVGDVWNISNSFILNYSNYEAGTNVVCITATSSVDHDGDNWDALGGVSFNLPEYTIVFNDLDYGNSEGDFIQSQLNSMVESLHSSYLDSAVHNDVVFTAIVNWNDHNISKIPCSIHQVNNIKYELVGTFCLSQVSTFRITIDIEENQIAKIAYKISEVNASNEHYYHIGDFEQLPKLPNTFDGENIISVFGTPTSIINAIKNGDIIIAKRNKNDSVGPIKNDVICDCTVKNDMTGIDIYYPDYIEKVIIHVYLEKSVGNDYAGEMSYWEKINMNTTIS